jgi:hypothetical protein
MAALSSFPAIPPSTQNELYGAIIDQARANFADYERFSNLTEEVAPLAAAWGERHALLLAGTADPMPSVQEQEVELNTKLDLYIKYRKVRDNLLKIVGIYNAAIKECTPPAVTPEVERFLVALQRSKVNLKDLQAGLDQVFIEGVAQLTDQKDKIHALYIKIVPLLQTLCSSLEVLALKVKGYAPLGIQYNTLKLVERSTTPLVKGMVRAREAALAEIGVV